MTLINHKKYIFYSLLGWVLLYLSILTLDKISYRVTNFVDDENKAKIAYFIVEGISCGLLAFFVSFMLLYFIDKKKDYSKITKKEVVLFTCVFSFSQIIYSLLIWPILDFWYVYFFNNDISLTFINKLTNIPIFATTFFIWLFVTLTIKFITHINQVTIKQLDLESSLKESQLNTLKGQINPHFMFNTLNNIRGLVIENPNKSREMITRLSEMLRYSLTKDKLDAISLEEELETVENYIAISKIQFEDRLTFEKNITVNSKQVQIPPMIIQMLIENAIKHGISTLKNGGKVLLDIKETGSNLHIQVSNDGHLSINKNTTQVGVENIQQRLFLLYKKKATFNLSKKDNIVTASIQIPL